MQTTLSTVLLTFIFILNSLSIASIRKVPQDYAKIQQAINAGMDGDTILVDHGLYVENIRYLGKKIIIASRFIVDNDTAHISETIIDGSSPNHIDSASVVTFDAGTDSASKLCGFTIQGGKGNKHDDPLTSKIVVVGGGIDLFGNGGTIVHNHIINNEIKSTYPLGAALCAWDQSNAHENSNFIIIEHNSISNNSLNGYVSFGGGVAIAMNGQIQSNIIRDNKANGSSQAAGGGVTIWGNSKIKLANNIIVRNQSSFFAGAMLIFQWVVGIPVVTMTNNTICFNTANQGAEGISWNVSVKMLNNIIWNPGDGTEIENIVWTVGEKIATDNSRLKGSMKNLIRGGYFGIDIIDEEPLFADTVLFRPSPLSPAIARGSMREQLDSEYVSPSLLDYLGNVRPDSDGTAPDLGAIESEYSKRVAVGAQPKYIIRDISFGGNKRNMNVFLPRAYDGTGKNFPLMIFLHGAGLSPGSTLTYGFYLIADTMNFIIVSPKSLQDQWYSAETDFINALIDTMVTEFRIDTNNIFVGGQSNGAYMTYTFGLNTRKKIKGIATVAGLLQSNDGGVRPASPISLISFHSTADAAVPYNGRSGYLGAEQSLFKWLSYLSCGTTLDTVNLSDPFPQNSNTVQRLSSQCAPVVFYKITGGSHAWPGPYYTHMLAYPTIPDINATLEILRFFQSQTITQVNSEISDRIPEIYFLYQNYPNPFNPSTTICYSIPDRSNVRLSIFNTLGQKISEIVNETKDAGSYEHSFNASQLSSGISAKGAYASGVYFYRIEATSVNNSKTFVETKKMVLIR
ncbi:MAG: T9SS type A sorting domain-containing protein [Bacteroidota bacterium]